jgi:hypothetical protein
MGPNQSVRVRTPNGHEARRGEVKADWASARGARAWWAVPLLLSRDSDTCQEATRVHREDRPSLGHSPRPCPTLQCFGMAPLNKTYGTAIKKHELLVYLSSIRIQRSQHFELAPAGYLSGDLDDYPAGSLAQFAPETLYPEFQSKVRSRSENVCFLHWKRNELST